MSAEPATPPDEAPQHWLSVKEKRAVLGMRILLFVTTVFGRGPGRLLLRFIALYYVLFYRSVRRHSRDYLRRILPGEVSFLQIYRHVLTFAQVLLDRFFMIKPRGGRWFHVETHGIERILALRDGKRGAILLGAHLGSFEVMSLRAFEVGLRLNIVGYFRNAVMINAFLDAANPEATARVIHIEPGSVSAVFQIRGRLQAGELVALLGDRTGLNEREVEVTFLGERARLPAGPWLLAAALRCPVYLTFGLYLGGNRYEVSNELFAELVELPRKRRDEALAEWVQRYADRLEHYCRRAPYNWFNFYDFWA